MPRRALSDEQAAEVRRRYAEGGGRRGVIVALSREYQLDPRALAQLLRGQSYQEPASSPRIRRSAAPGLTPAQRRTIVARYDAGESAEALAGEYGITRAYVWRLWSGAGGKEGRQRRGIPRPRAGWKRCGACGTERPSEDFNQRRVRPVGSQSWCRACAADYEREWRLRTAMTITVTEKYCGQCERVKPASEFHSNRSRRDGLATACKPCTIAEVQRRRRERRRA